MRIYSKIFFVFATLFFLFYFFKTAAAASDLPTITIINLIRGNDLGHETHDLAKSLRDQWQVTQESGVNATWLFAYSALENKDIVKTAKELKGQELGLLFEIDRNHATKAQVIPYRGQGAWYFSDGLFLNSYDIEERKRLIDTAFAKFKDEFGYYPKTVGAWWIGGDSLTYMQQKYGIVAALKAADQYDLDFYTILGSPYSIPYVASKENESIPAASFEDSSKVVILQWAARDPLRGYEEPRYSEQDYGYYKLSTDYVDYIASIFLKKQYDNMVFGLENGGTLEEFRLFYKTMIDKAHELEQKGVARIDFAKNYAQDFLNTRKVFPNNTYNLAKDYSTENQSFWYNSENYRAGIFKTGENIYLVDVRNYAEKTPEDFSVLPNSEKHLRMDVPALIDAIHFPDKKILLAKSKEPLTIKEGNPVVLSAGGQEIAQFKKDTFSTQNRTFTFTKSSQKVTILRVIAFLYIFYFGFLYLQKKSFTKARQEITFLLLPLVCALPFLVYEPTYLFDKKEAILLSLLPLSVFPTVQSSIFVFKIAPFVILFAVHYFLRLRPSKRKHHIIYFIILGLISLLYVHVPYFSLDRATYKYVFLGLGVVALVLSAITFGIFYKTKSKKLLFLFLALIPVILGIMSGVVLISRNQYALTPFEVNALQAIKEQKKDVLWVYQAEFGIVPIYRDVRPLLYNNTRISQNLTGKKWETAVRPSSHILEIKNYDNKIIVEPFYLGSDISPHEIKVLNLKKIFDNIQIAIFEKNLK